MGLTNWLGLYLMWKRMPMQSFSRYGILSVLWITMCAGCKFEYLLLWLRYHRLQLVQKYHRPDFYLKLSILFQSSGEFCFNRCLSDHNFPLIDESPVQNWAPPFLFICMSSQSLWKCEHKERLATTCGKRRCCRLLEVHPEKWVELMVIGQFKQVVITFLICMSINVFTQND